MEGSIDRNLNGVRVLVVEDEPVVANVVRRFLAAEGAEVLIASSAETAHSALDSDAPWHLVLLDQKLPDGDGLEILDRLDGFARRPALVAISGFLQDSKRSLKLQTSRATLLPKPFDRDDLFRAVADALARAAKESADVDRTGKSITGKSGEYVAVLAFGPICVDLVTQAVTVGGRCVELQPAQFRILAQMLASPGRPFTVRELVEGSLRGTHCDGSSNIRFQIHALRRRLGSGGKVIERSTAGYGVGLGEEREHTSISKS